LYYIDVVCVENDIRLTSNSTSEAEGHLEICRNDIWSPVCASFFSSVEARVACYQLGYSRRSEYCLCFSFLFHFRGGRLLLLTSFWCQPTVVL